MQISPRSISIFPYQLSIAKPADYSKSSEEKQKINNTEQEKEI